MHRNIAEQNAEQHAEQKRRTGGTARVQSRAQSRVLIRMQSRVQGRMQSRMQSGKQSVKHCKRRKSSESNRKSNTRLTAQDESKTALSVGSPVLAGAATQEQQEQAEKQHNKSVVSREALARALRALAGRFEKG